jgi:hypothetical protein
MLHIVGWNTHYENANSRKYKKLSSVMVPNHFDGSRYAELITGENGVARYAAWITLICTAARGTVEQRGYLLRSDGTPHTAASLALITRIPAPIYEDAIPALIRLGWVEDVDAKQALRGKGGNARAAKYSKPAPAPTLKPAEPEPADEDL